MILMSLGSPSFRFLLFLVSSEPLVPLSSTLFAATTPYSLVVISSKDKKGNRNKRSKMVEVQGDEEPSVPIFRDIRRYYCEFCGICRSKKTLIATHILSEHQDELKEKEIEGDDVSIGGSRSGRTCEECGATFKKPAYLKQHMQSHSLERPFVCPVDDCNSSYRRKDHLNRHLLQHEGKLFKCPVENCASKFSIQSNIKRHLREFHEDKHNHREPKKHVCQEPKKHVCQEPGCGKEFPYASKLRKHEDSHVKLDSIEAFCAEPSCMKPFTNNECLKAHILSCHQHLICEICGSKQLRKNIKRHMRCHEEQQIKRIKCTFEDCDHTFTCNSNLQQHIKAVHLELRPYACRLPGCGMRFSFKHVRDNHEQTIRHTYVHGDFEEVDELFRSRPRGGRRKKCPSIETLSRKRVTPPNQLDGVMINGSEYLSWLLSSNDDEDEL